MSGWADKAMVNELVRYFINVSDGWGCTCCLCRIEDVNDAIGMRDAFGDNNSVLETLSAQIYEDLENGKHR